MGCMWMVGIDHCLNMIGGCDWHELCTYVMESEFIKLIIV